MNPPVDVVTGRFGEFGGRFVAEPLMAALDELDRGFAAAWGDDRFVDLYERYLVEYGARPTLLYQAERLSELYGVDIWLKREDLTHTGSHKINNVLGQALLAKRLGKTRLIAETGAGQHGVATATAAARFGFECTVYMGAVDVARQELNVFRMRLLGAEVISVKGGSATLKDAVNEAMREWVACLDNTHYCIGSVMGPHPYPWMVREFQSVIGKEARGQFLARTGRLPDVVVACVGGGSNAAGTFAGFLDDPVELVGVEPSGGAAIGKGTQGIVHGMLSYFLQDEVGQVREANSISAGLDYPGVGPEHAYLANSHRAHYENVSDDQVVVALKELAATEGILCALESAHALAWVSRERGELSGKSVLVTLSGRGDKDAETLAHYGAQR